MDHNSASLTEVARYFGRDVTTINNGVRQFRERSNKDKQFRQQVTRVEERLVQIKTSQALMGISFDLSYLEKWPCARFHGM